MNGLAVSNTSWDHVCSLTGLRVSSPFSSIHSWNVCAHDEMVEWGRVGMLASRSWEKMWERACPESGLS